MPTPKEKKLKDLDKMSDAEIAKALLESRGIDTSGMQYNEPSDATSNPSKKTMTEEEKKAEQRKRQIQLQNRRAFHAAYGDVSTRDVVDNRQNTSPQVYKESPLTRTAINAVPPTEPPKPQMKPSTEKGDVKWILEQSQNPTTSKERTSKDYYDAMTRERNAEIQKGKQGEILARSARIAQEGERAASMAGQANVVQPQTTSQLLESKLSGNAVTPTTQTTTPTTTTPTTTPQKTYTTTEIMNRINQLEQPYEPITEVDLAEERKRRKRETIMGAIGEGVSALSNLYFTTQGAQNAYNPSMSLTGKIKERYDALKAEREANRDKQLQYLYRQYGLAKADEAEAKADARYKEQKETEERRWQKQQSRLNKAEEREESRFKTGKETEEKRYQEGKAEKEKVFKEGVRRFDIQTAQAKKRYNLDEERVKMADARARLANKQYGDVLSFTDAKSGEKLNIASNIFESSYGQIFDAMINEGIVKLPSATQAIYDNIGLTSKEKMDFIKDNWHKSPAARKYLTNFANATAQIQSTETENKQPLTTISSFYEGQAEKIKERNTEGSGSWNRNKKE